MKLIRLTMDHLGDLAGHDMVMRRTATVEEPAPRATEPREDRIGAALRRTLGWGWRAATRDTNRRRDIGDRAATRCSYAEWP